MLEFIIVNFQTIAGAILLTCFGGYIAYRNGYKIRLAQAAATFRTAINPDAFANWRGHNLHKALVSSFPAHKAAVTEFRRYLRWMPIDRLRLYYAWKTYHGGNENYPELFKPYCLSDNGYELLIKRLESLRNAGNHT